MDPAEPIPHETSDANPADRLSLLAEYEKEGGIEEIASGLDDQIRLVEDRIAQCGEEDPPADLESMRLECRRVEQDLGIHSLSDRMAEAQLFIDDAFLKVAALRGDEHPEELFGIEAWRGWLNARLRLRSIDRLTVDDILALHADLAHGMPDAQPGQLRSGSSWGDDYVSQGTPVTLDRVAFAEISQNPYVRFLVTGPGPHTGYIDYASLGGPTRLDKFADDFFDGDRERLRSFTTNEPFLEELLKDALEKVEYPSTEGSELDSMTICEQAAKLQRSLVSIHPFNDCNGRLSRLVMNWYLEKHGLPPAILKEFDNDIVSPMDLWTNEIDAGTRCDRNLHPEARTPAESLFSVDELEFYTQCYKKYYALPPDPAGLMKHAEYKEYLDAFINESSEFVALTRNDHVEFPYISDRVLSKEYGDLHVGGLIPEAYIEMWGDTRPEKQAEIRRRFCAGDTMIYRGIELTQEPSSYRDLLVFFKSPVAATTGYRTLAERLMSPKSLRPIECDRVKASLRTYNEILIRDFLVHRNRDEGAQLLLQGEVQTAERNMRFMAGLSSDSSSHLLKNLEISIEQGKYLANLTHLHAQGITSSALWVSPGVSTSIDQHNARDYVTGRSSVFLEAVAPGWGAVYLPSAGSDIPLFIKAKIIPSFQFEKEMTVMGAIDPNSIMRVTLTSQAEAVREVGTGDILLTDRSTDITERWSFDDSGDLVYVSSTQNTPSTSDRQTPFPREALPPALVFDPSEDDEIMDI